MAPKLVVQIRDNGVQTATVGAHDYDRGSARGSTDSSDRVSNERLRAENERLEAEVATLRRQLVQLETQQGLSQLESRPGPLLQDLVRALGVPQRTADEHSVSATMDTPRTTVTLRDAAIAGLSVDEVAGAISNANTPRTVVGQSGYLEALDTPLIATGNIHT